MRRGLGLLLFGVLMLMVAGGAVVAYVLLTADDHVVAVDDVDRAADQRLLFIGNSFIHSQDIDQLVASLAEAQNGAWDDVLAGAVAPGGYRLTEHAADANDSGDNPPLRQLLVTGSDTVRAWDLVVLQGQSQIMGFGNEAASKADLLQQVPSLAQHAHDTGATVLLMMTWGYAEGDANNPGIYGDFLAMQTRLAQGYDNLAGILTVNHGIPVYVAPVGLGFQMVYEDLIDTGQDPLASGSRFRRLYSDDNQHPALPGSYLAACIILASYTGERMSEVAWQPGGLDAELARYLREVADRTVFGSRFGGRGYPWN